MLQIKTIRDKDAADFDAKVNAALADGWRLVRRMSRPLDLIAELERVEYPVAERGCDNCAYSDRDALMEPCCFCEDSVEGYPTRWEPADNRPENLKIFNSQAELMREGHPGFGRR